MDIKFRTELTIRPSDKKINHTSRVLFIGSCFSENMGSLLTANKINTLVNPFGVIYNPDSIKRVLEFAIENKRCTETDLIKHKDSWLSLNHHSQFDSDDVNKVIDDINSVTEQTHQFLKEANHVFITLGTSWVYEYSPTKNIVANCHKIPNKEFTKRMLTFLETSRLISELTQLLKQFNSSLEIVYTVSPVRHIKDGFIENQHSKSNLISALQENINNSMQAAYFPSYELINDDLRDYRYYADDLLHPNKQALNYIYQKFSDCCFSNDTIRLNKEIEEIKSFLAHKPFTVKSVAYQDSLSVIISKMEVLKNANPQLDFSQEQQLIENLKN